MDVQKAEKKYSVLEKKLGRLPSLLVAFSGGVDSTFLLAAARKVMGKRVVAVTVASHFHPEAETVSAGRIAGELGIRHVLIPLDELKHPEIAANTAERCYYCKRLILGEVAALAGREGIVHIAHGANTDDLSDYRPGARAARELGVLSPLADAGLSKAEIRYLSKNMGLSTWNKPAMACLASRIPYGTPITRRALRRIEGAEDLLRSLGFLHCRVRHHGDVARIEVAAGDIESIAAGGMRSRVVERFKRLGYRYVALDMEGYVQGSMNRGNT